MTNGSTDVYPRRLMPTPPVVRVHLTAATLDAAAAVCHVRGLPHLVAKLDAAANEIRQQHDTDITPNKGEQP